VSESVDGMNRNEWSECVGIRTLAYNTYLSLREKGIPAEDARSVLPNATKTEVVTTYTT